MSHFIKHLPTPPGPDNRQRKTSTSLGVLILEPSCSKDMDLGYYLWVATHPSPAGVWWLIQCQLSARKNTWPLRGAQSYPKEFALV